MDSAERWADVAARIQQRLIAKGWNQADLCREAGLSPEGVRPILKGKPGNPRGGTLAKISLALDWPGDGIDRILRGEEPEAEQLDEVRALRAEVAELRALVLRLDSALGAPSTDGATR